MEALENGHAAVLLMLDLSAAFDTLEHQILIKQLRHMYGFEGDVLAWIRSYLKDQRQVVYIDGVESTGKSLWFAMPQGSVLGTKVYCLYSLCSLIVISVWNNWFCQWRAPVFSKSGTSIELKVPDKGCL